MKELLKKNPLYFAFLLPAVVDGVLTLLGQNNQYWSTDRIVNEASPAYYFLLFSPWVYLIGALIWFVALYFIFLRIKQPFNLILALLFITGHSWGGGGWIMKLFREYEVYSLSNQGSIIIAWGILMAYFLVVASIATYSLNIYFKNRN